MAYEIQYDIMSLIAAGSLLFVYVLRRNYKSKSNTILLLLLICDLLSAAFDIASCYAIVYPFRYPMWLDIFMTLGYIFFYNMMGVLFFAYIDSRTKIDSMWKPAKLLIGIVVLLEAFWIWSSPVTHLISYFDENRGYHHGPLMVALYVVAGTLLFLSAVMFVIERRRFSTYQVGAICAFIVAVFTGVLVQYFFPNVLVGQFACTLVLFFIYVALENPVYYTYKETRCFNRLAFLETMKNKLRSSDELNIMTVGILEYDYLRANLSLKDLERLSSRIAGFIRSRFGQNAFCIADDKFVILIKQQQEEAVIQKILDEFFSQPIMLIDTSVSVSVHTTVILDIDKSLKIDVIESGITYLLDHAEAFSDKTDRFSDVVQSVRRRKDISYAVRSAMQKDLFEVYYQPIRNVRTGKFTSVEALIRLKDTQYGFISPEEFIPIAESEGMILKIGEMVFEKVCRFIRESRCIQKYGVNYIEINLSPLQCFQTDLVERFAKIMENYQVNPKWINLEITETASFEEDDLMFQNINELYEMGTTFSLDDFGSGFASLDYLFKLPVDIVKIDKSILWQSMKDPNAMIILTTTLQMIKELGKRVVVEGVEDEAMVELLTENDCDYMQGYYYSKPLPPEEYLAFLSEENGEKE